MIFVVPNPRGWARWGEAEALLEPARKLGNFATVLDDQEVLWAVLDGDDLLAAATTRMTADKHWEVLLVGGRDHRRWVGEMNRVWGEVARGAGATRLIAMGRAGWRKALKALGWDSLGEVDGMTVYSRELECGQEEK